MEFVDTAWSMFVGFGTWIQRNPVVYSKVDKEETEPQTCGFYVTSGDEILTREDSDLKAITLRQRHDLYNVNC